MLAFLSSQSHWAVFNAILLLLLHTPSCDATFLKGLLADRPFSEETTLTGDEDLRWARHPGPHNVRSHLDHDLTDLLALRDVDTDPIFEKAMQVIDSITTQSTCHQAATGQLLITCKTVGNQVDLDQGKNELLERAKSVYAVRLAVCETGEGRAAIPKTCKAILTLPRHFHGELEVVNSKSLSPCLEALMAEHYYWTSYSNSRQDASTLCQAVTLEATKLEALQSYQRLAELIPEFRSDLLASRAKWLEFMRLQEQYIHQFHELHEKGQEEMGRQQSKGLSDFSSVVDNAKLNLENASKTMQQSMERTASDVGRSYEVVGHILDDFASLRAMLQDASSFIGKLRTENAEIQTRDMAKIRDMAIHTSEALQDIKTHEFTTDMRNIFAQMRAEMQSLVTSQAAQSSDTEQNLRLSQALSEAQQTNLDLVQRMTATSSGLASKIETAGEAASRVVDQMEAVNSALTLVENASSKLGLLFSVFAVPARLGEIIHLRLMGLMALPTVWLYLLGVKRWSYILTTSYVFIECFNSLLAEHSAMILHLSQKTKKWYPLRVPRPLQPLTKGHFVLWSAIVLLLLWSYIVMMMWVQDRQRRKGQSINRSEAFKLHDDRQRSNRLRRGQRFEPAADRFRRAATVC